MNIKSFMCFFLMMMGYLSGYPQKSEVKKIKTSEIKINIQNWADGIYLVKATIGGTLLSNKLIVSK